MQSTRLNIELYRQEGKNFRSVRARIDGDAFIIETQDMGKVVEEIFDTDDYEFWTTVPKESWPALLIALAKELFHDDPKATDRLKSICEENSILHKWERWI